MRYRLSNFSAGFGILFLIVGLLLYCTFWLIFYSFPCLLVGTCLILLSTKTWKFKTAIITPPLAFVAYSFWASFTTPEVYLIPLNYKGNVIVVFNQEDGQREEFEGSRRVYRIPSTGVLFTRFKDEQGFMEQYYYYVSPSGKRIKLGVLDTRSFNEEWTTVKNTKEPSRDSLAIFNPGTMGTMSNSDNVNKKVFSELSVGTYNDLKNFKELNTEYIDSLKTATIKVSE